MAGQYGQIIALSQETINKNFSKLFKDQPEILWSDIRSQLTAKVSPRIDLFVDPGFNDPILSIQICFDKGKIQFAGDKQQVIDGWVITYTDVNLQSKVLLVDPADAANAEALDEEAAKLEDTYEQFELGNKTLMIPGEYSIHRLFACIAEFEWDTPIWELSFMTDPNGKKVYLDDWASEVQECLRNWSLEHGNFASLFIKSLGMKLQIPRAKVSKEKISFPVRALRLQNYPYIKEGTTKGENGNPYNCLCFCEVAGGDWTLPGTPLQFSRNLAGPMSSENSLGSFAFGFVNMASPTLIDSSEIFVPLPPTPIRVLGVPWPLENPRVKIIPLDEAIPQMSSFSKLSGLPYFFETNYPTEGSGSAALPYPWPWDEWLLLFKIDRKFKISIERPDTSRLLVSGSNIYRYWVENIGDKYYLPTPPWGPGEDSDDQDWAYVDSVSWSFDIDLNISENGTMKPVISRCQTYQDALTGVNIMVSIDLTVDQRGLERSGVNDSIYTWEIINAQLRSNLGRAIKGMQNTLGKHVGFIKPGMDEPKQDRIIWPENPGDGDDPEIPDDGGDPEIPGDEGGEIPGPIPELEYVTDPSVTDDIPHLNWECSVKSYNSGTEIAQLGIIASNRSGASIAFKSVRAMFLKMKDMDGNQFFKADLEAWKEKGSSSTETWSITADRIAQDLSIKIEPLDNGFQFKIFPTVIDTDPDGTELPDKFIVPANGSFTLELNGSVFTKEKAGTYIVQLNEDWAGAKVSEPIKGRADAFVVLELDASGQIPSSRYVSQEEADKIRGVPQ